MNEILYRQKQEVVKAFQMTAQTINDHSLWPDFVKEIFHEAFRDVAVYPAIWIRDDGRPMFDTMLSMQEINIGDWIVKFPAGNIMLFQDGVFSERYEPIIEAV